MTEGSSVRPAFGMAAHAVVLAPLVLGACLGTESHATKSQLDPTPVELAASLDFDGVPTADDPNWHTAQLRAGGAFMGDFRTRVDLDLRPLSFGTEVDFEDDLGIDDNVNVGRFDGFYRFNRYHRIDATYYDIERDTSAVIDEEIEWGGVTFPVAARVDATFDTQIFKLAYGYTLIPEDDWEFGFTAGFHVVRLDTGLSGRVSTGSGEVFASEKIDVTAPLPVVGLRGEWAITPDLRLIGSSEWFYLKLDLSDRGELSTQVEGFLTDNNVVLEWDAFEHFGLGVGYNFFLMDASLDKGPLRLSGTYAYSGLMLFGRVYF